MLLKEVTHNSYELMKKARSTFGSFTFSDFIIAEYRTVQENKIKMLKQVSTL